ncbi:50S ribosomal protein L11 methyltransferase [Thermosulfurimonas sp. F29]|uniref:50S ribosomal protein L11 methyltransferase n=1 Tax=Thermosulfurimonas sp. F29 TaxID=2867247 RepID=UPI001C839E2B|nr:50S ribosomal protein L11 methyltransferase [Thermosulfurimonas sp. F29]MBX6422489.1 50S ribosomal protein L11 methyltransferase [Thermosulfurimonas sp. F29]
MDRGKPQTYLRVEVGGSFGVLEKELPELAERWGGFLFKECSSGVRAEFYLNSAEEVEPFRRDCRRRGLEVISITEVPAEDWARTWQEHFRAFQVSARLWVRPPWESLDLSEGKIEIVLDPGQAFGTGHHPTTALMLRALDNLSFRKGIPKRVLDVGCGTGILAIAAAKLGAHRVVALDIDPMAREATRHNVLLNRVKVEIFPGILDDLHGVFDLVLANLSTWELHRLRYSLRKRLAPGGLLFISGFLGKEIPEMAKSFREIGLMVVEEHRREEWGFLALRRSTD